MEEVKEEVKTITWEDLEQVNKEIITVDIKGKQYAEVNKRIIAFRKLFPLGLIEPEIISNENGVIVMKTSVYDNNGNLLAVGHAYEKENSTFINKTSYIENCETSSIGRALGLCGIGVDNSIASADEEINATVQQKVEGDYALRLMSLLKTLIIQYEVNLEKLLETYDVSNLSDMTKEQLEDAIAKINKKYVKE